jgi:hypothetical protein
MGPRDGGDEYQETPPGTAANSMTTPPSLPPEDDEDVEAHAVPAPLIFDAAQRIASVETRAVQRRATKAGDQVEWQAWLLKYCRAERDRVLKVLAPLGSAFGVPAGATAAAAMEIEASAVASLQDGVPDGWEQDRATEITGILEKSFRTVSN